MDLLSKYCDDADSEEEENLVEEMLDATDLCGDVTEALQPQDTSPTENATTWACTLCSFENDDCNASCLMCYFVRDGSEWECPDCQATTPRRRVTCVKCSYRLETVPIGKHTCSDPVVRENEAKRRKRELILNNAGNKSHKNSIASSVLEPPADTPKKKHVSDSSRQKSPQRSKKQERKKRPTIISDESSDVSASEPSPLSLTPPNEDFLPDDRTPLNETHESSKNKAGERKSLLEQLRAKQAPPTDPRLKHFNASPDRSKMKKLTKEEVASIREASKHRATPETSKRKAAAPQQYLPTRVSAPRKVPPSPPSSQDHSSTTSPSPAVVSPGAIESITGQINLLGDLFRLHREIFSIQLEFLHATYKSRSL